MAFKVKKESPDFYYAPFFATYVLDEETNEINLLAKLYFVPKPQLQLLATEESTTPEKQVDQKPAPTPPPVPVISENKAVAETIPTAAKTYNIYVKNFRQEVSAAEVFLDLTSNVPLCITNSRGRCSFHLENTAFEQSLFLPLVVRKAGYETKLINNFSTQDTIKLHVEINKIPSLEISTFKYTAQDFAYCPDVDVYVNDKFLGQTNSQGFFTTPFLDPNEPVRVKLIARQISQIPVERTIKIKDGSRLTHIFSPKWFIPVQPNIMPIQFQGNVQRIQKNILRTAFLSVVHDKIKSRLKNFDYFTTLRIEPKFVIDQQPTLQIAAINERKEIVASVSDEMSASINDQARLDRQLVAMLKKLLADLPRKAFVESIDKEDIVIPIANKNQFSFASNALVEVFDLLPDPNNTNLKLIKTAALKIKSIHATKIICNVESLLTKAPLRPGNLVVFNKGPTINKGMANAQSLRTSGKQNYKQ